MTNWFSCPQADWTFQLIGKSTALLLLLV